MDQAIWEKVQQATAEECGRLWSLCSSLLDYVEARLVPDVCKNAVWPIEFAAEGLVDITLPLATYRTSFLMSETEMDDLEANIDSPTEILRIVGQRVFDAQAFIARVIEADALTGTGVDANGNPTLIGIFGGALGIGVYAGVDPVAHPDWSSLMLTNGGIERDLTQVVLAQAWTKVDKHVPRRALAFVSRGTGCRYEALFDGSEVRSPYVPAGKLAIFNPFHLRVQYSVPTPCEKNVPIQTTRIPLRFAQIVKSGDHYKISVRVSLAMAHVKRGAASVITDIREVPALKDPIDS